MRITDKMEKFFKRTARTYRIEYGDGITFEQREYERTVIFYKAIGYMNCLMDEYEDFRYKNIDEYSVILNYISDYVNIILDSVELK